MNIDAPTDEYCDLVCNSRLNHISRAWQTLLLCLVAFDVVVRKSDLVPLQMTFFPL